MNQPYALLTRERDETTIYRKEEIMCIERRDKTWGVSCVLEWMAWSLFIGRGKEYNKFRMHKLRQSNQCLIKAIIKQWTWSQMNLDNESGYNKCGHDK